MPHYVYILECSDKTYYTGITKDVSERFLQHQNGKSRSTRHRRPVLLKSFFCFPHKQKAAEFEKYLKSHSGRASLKKHLV